MKKAFKSLGISALIVLCGFILGHVLESYTAPTTNYTIVTGPYYTTPTSGNLFTGKLDTIAATAKDTFRATVGASVKSLVFTNDFYTVSGTPTVNVTCLASVNGGVSYDTVPITTYTVYPNSTTRQVTRTYLVNGSFGGNPYTNYMWIGSSSASSTVSWQGGVFWR